MPDLDFKITSVEAADHGITPLLHFKLEVTNTPAGEVIQSVMLQAQIQLQSTQRAYKPAEKEKLSEIFGTPDQWGQTLRARLWTHASATVREFTGTTETVLTVPCTYDLNVSATKYFYALEDGEVPLLFLFSGTIFYRGPDERVQIQQVSWNKECAYRMPISTWQKMMDRHYPNMAWLSLDRDLYERLYAFRRREGLATWDRTIAHLLSKLDESELAVTGVPVGEQQNEKRDVDLPPALHP